MMPRSLTETARRTRHIENAGVLRVASQQEIERSNESRYDYHLYGGRPWRIRRRRELGVVFLHHAGLFSLTDASLYYARFSKTLC